MCLAHFHDDADYNYDYDDYLDADADANNDDDDDDSYASYSSSEDEFDFYNNTPNVIFDMHGNQFTIDNNDNVVPYDNKPMNLQAAQRQILLLAAIAIKEFTNQAKHKHDEFFLPKTTTCNIPITVTPSSTPTYAKNNDHGAFLFH